MNDTGGMFALLVMTMAVVGLGSSPEEKSVPLSDEEIILECFDETERQFSSFEGGWQQYPVEVNPVAVNVKYNISREVMDSCYPDYAGMTDLEPSEMSPLERKLFFSIAISYHQYVMDKSSRDWGRLSTYIAARANRLKIFQEMCALGYGSYQDSSWVDIAIESCVISATEV